MGAWVMGGLMCAWVVGGLTHLSVTRTNYIKLLLQIIALYFLNHAITKDTVSGRSSEFLNLKST